MLNGRINNYMGLAFPTANTTMHTLKNDMSTKTQSVAFRLWFIANYTTKDDFRVEAEKTISSGSKMTVGDLDKQLLSVERIKKKHATLLKQTTVSTDKKRTNYLKMRAEHLFDTFIKNNEVDLHKHFADLHKRELAKLNHTDELNPFSKNEYADDDD